MRGDPQDFVTRGGKNVFVMKRALTPSNGHYYQFPASIEQQQQQKYNEEATDH